jgi:hypothetical protein
MRQKRPPAARPANSIPAGPIELSPTAQALVDRVSAEWSLSPPAAALLRLIGENLTRAELCDAVLALEGLHTPDAKGSVKVHPLALLSRDHRNAAANGLQKLMSNLET